MKHEKDSSCLLYLDAKERTLSTLLERQAERCGDKPLASIRGKTLTYAEAPQLAARYAAGLEHAGIRHGDRVAVMCRNRLELFQLVLGCGWLGAVAVPINTAARGLQLEHMLNNSGARLLVIEADFGKRLAGLALSPALERVWVLDGEFAEVGPYHAEQVPVLTAHTVSPAARPHDTAVIMYTSGTTGPSKGVCVSQAQLYWWGISVAELLELSERDVLFNPMPLYHINALSTPLQALVAGASCVIAERFSVSQFWNQVRSCGASVGYLLGAMANMLSAGVSVWEERAHRMRLALAPGASAELVESFHHRFGVRLVQAYASTETNCALGSRLAEQRPGMLGYVRSGFDARVVDCNDIPVPDGTPGELVLRHQEPFAFSSGYFGMPEKTVDAWRNLWFHTGDRVIRSPDGWFKFMDRLTDSIRRRGENISSFEVESVICESPGVRAAAAFGVPAAVGEEDVMIAVVLQKGIEPDPLGLIHHCETRLAYFAIPRYVDFVENLPVTENGKVRKSALRARGVTATAWDREAQGYVSSRD